MPAFKRYLGIDYSGAKTPGASLKGIRVYEAVGSEEACEIAPPASPRKYWTREGLAKWLIQYLSDPTPTLVGIDHGLSFPLRYFEKHRILPDWDAFLRDFVAHWPTGEDDTYVDFVRDGLRGRGDERSGSARWRRTCEECCRAKSVFHFDVPGSVAKSTHAGLPWILKIREARPQLHFWPFDGWDVPPNTSVFAEAYPSQWKNSFPKENLSSDQRDAKAIAQWCAVSDANGSLSHYLHPALLPGLKMQAQVEGWILGVLPEAFNRKQ
jgi:hypothetical protein